MKIYSSYEEAFNACISEKYFSVAHLYHREKTMGLHTQECYEIYYSVCGGRRFLIDGRLYDINPGDVFFINPFESHQLMEVDEKTHERFVINVYPDFLETLCTPQTDLNICFRDHDSELGHRISLTKEDQNRFLFYMNGFEDIRAGYGEDVIGRHMAALFLVFVNTRFLKYREMQSGVGRTYNIPIHNEQVDRILSYINQHIEEPISIEQLAGQFYLSASYICRVFKAATGTTINTYITSKRIAHAKQLLTEGYSIADVAEKSGFGDYSNFFKAFTKYAGISPQKYAQLSNGRITKDTGNSR